MPAGSGWGARRRVVPRDRQFAAEHVLLEPRRCERRHGEHVSGRPRRAGLPPVDDQPQLDRLVGKNGTARPAPERRRGQRRKNRGTVHVASPRGGPRRRSPFARAGAGRSWLLRPRRHHRRRLPLAVTPWHAATPSDWPISTDLPGCLPLVPQPQDGVALHSQRGEVASSTNIECGCACRPFLPPGGSKESARH